MRTRAVIHLVQGRTREALRDCGALLGRANNLITVSCLADARSRSGAALEARAALAALLATPEARSASAAEKNWALTLAAELAARLESPDAPAAFDAALAAGADAYLKTAHADWLLAQQRAADVVALYGREQHSDNLLVRVAIAQQLKADPQAAATRSLLETRFATARARGDALHEREEALLALRTGSGEALPLAQENWQTQREPFDAQLLLEASLAARDRAAAAPVLDWMRDTQIQDPALLRLRAQLEAAP